MRSSAAERQELENKIFDAHAVTPKQLLLEMFEMADVLFIGEANHSNYRALSYLQTLLDEVGNDPRLKTVVLKRFGDHDEFYSKLSNQSLEKTLSETGFPSEESRQMSLCGGPQWAYSIANLLPSIRQINLKRRGNPILVRTMDGMLSTRPLFG